MIRIERIFLVLLVAVAGCAAGKNTYHDAGMDFGLIQKVGVLPFQNLTRETLAGQRARDILMTKLQATGAFYVIPTGEIARGVSRTRVADPVNPSPEEIKTLGGILAADAFITGTVNEYGEIRSGSSTSNVVSLSLKLMESQTGKVVWSSSVTKGGISTTDRLFGSGGRPITELTEDAADAIIKNLFK